MPFRGSETSQRGAVWGTLLPFIPLGPLNPNVVWPSLMYNPYLTFINSLPGFLQAPLRQDWFSNHRWASVSAVTGNLLDRTFDHYNSIVPGLLEFESRQNIILRGFSPFGLHVHLGQLENEWLCTGLDILDIAMGDLVLSLALRVGLPIPFSLLLAGASQIGSSILLKGACPTTGEPVGMGTPDPWAYGNRRT